MRRDYQIAILLGISAVPAGVALMAAPYYAEALLKQYAPACFWAGLGMTTALLLAAILIAIKGEASEPQKGHKRRMIALVGMIVCGAGFLGSAAAYFWPVPSKIAEPLSFKVTDLAGFNDNAWPGTLYIVLYLDVRGESPAAAAITAFHLAFAPATGQRFESTAQVVLEARTFRGPDAQEEITPDNTLWGRNGAPEIHGFRSGKLWFAFSGINDFSFLSDLNTTAIFSVYYSNGRTYLLTFRLGDIGPVRPVTHPFPAKPSPGVTKDPPTARPPTLAPREKN